MSQSINQDITPVGLLKFAVPSISIFISRFLGSNALS